MRSDARFSVSRVSGLAVSKSRLGLATLRAALFVRLPFAVSSFVPMISERIAL